ncbi:MAG: O-antigen ligase family protein [Polyangiaceae bacterium]|jgi:O-antigen ligase
MGENVKRLVVPTLFVLLVGVTILCIRVGEGDPILALTPAIVLGALYFAWWVPLRWPLLITIFLALTLENPSDTPACGQWKSPFYEVGAALLVHLNVTLPQYKALAFSGLDLILAYLFVVAAVRYLKGSRIDARPDADVGPIGWLAGMSLAAVTWMWAYGMGRADPDVSSSLWQVQRVVYLPALVFLFQAGFRTARDGLAVGKVVVAAACLKAVLAIYIRATVAPPAGETFLQYATTHADSMLFSVAFCAVLARVIHRRRHRALLVAVVLPLLLAGMIANGRRLAWVELAVGVLAVVLLTPWSTAKRAFYRGLVGFSPLLLAYAAIGWSSESAVFRPIHTLRSVVDSKADPSTMWRDLENYDLFFTLRHNPIVGTGYGHGYDEIVWLPDISHDYALYRFLPHNSILGLWAYGGLIGFTALWMILVAGVFLAARAYRHATAADDRIVALTAIAIVVVYLAYCYGDLGLGTWTSVFLVAPALAVSSRLAVATGAWPTLRASAQPSPRAVPATAWGPTRVAETQT